MLLNRVIMRKIIGMVATVEIKLHFSKSVRHAVDHERVVVEHLGSDSLELGLELSVLVGVGVKVEDVKKILIEIGAVMRVSTT